MAFLEYQTALTWRATSHFEPAFEFVGSTSTTAGSNATRRTARVNFPGRSEPGIEGRIATGNKCSDAGARHAPAIWAGFGASVSNVFKEVARYPLLGPGQREDLVGPNGNGGSTSMGPSAVVKHSE